MSGKLGLNVMGVRHMPPCAALWYSLTHREVPQSDVFGTCDGRLL
jgi:hypothetical protein